MLILQKDAGVLRTGGRGCQLRRPTVSCKLPLACGRSLMNGVGDLWRPAKLSPWDTEEFRGFDEPVAFPEKPLPRGSARSLTEKRYRGVFADRVRAGRTSLNAIPSYSSHWIV